MSTTTIISPYDNKFLIVRPSIRLTPIISPVLMEMDKIFQELGVTARVTRGQSTSEDQLAIVVQYAKRYGVDKEFPEVLRCLATDKIGTSNEYVWQRAWSRLLNIGVIINPPYPAVALFDYIRNGGNRKGQRIGYSPHVHGTAFDIGGGTDHDISNELVVVEEAKRRKIPGLKGYLPERKNNCVHIDCIKIL